MLYKIKKNISNMNLNNEKIFYQIITSLVMELLMKRLIPKIKLLIFLIIVQRVNNKGGV